MAEEGTILFRHAFLHGNLSTLFYLSDISGYINIWLNVSTIFSNIVPLKYAPLVSVYLAFILLIYIFFYILFSTSHLLLDFKIKCVACSIVLFSPIMTAEVWLSPLNSMSYFGILTFLILFDKNHHTIFKKINPPLLLLSGLSGLYSSILTPLFFLKYIFSKNKHDLLNFSFLFLSFIIQLLIFIYAKTYDLVAPDRFFINYEKIINFIYNAYLKALFGREVLQILIPLVNIQFAKILLLFFFLLFLIFLILICVKKKDIIIIYILVALLIESLLIVFGSAYKEFAGGRYIVVPGAIILFSILRLFLIFNYNKLKYFFLTLIIFSLTTGFLEFKYLNQYPNFLSCNNCPVWREQIDIWKKDHKYLIKIWPYPKYQVQLY